jgi:HAD superfamily hydrolase (TIGR01509 family)
VSALKALIFDVDGTLAETEETHRRALNETFAAFALPWNWDQTTYRRLLRVMGGKERLVYFIEHDRPEKGAEAMARLGEIHSAKNARYVAMVRGGAVSLRPGVERLLREASAAGLRLAIATTTSRANVDALLAATLGSAGSALFETIAAGDEAPAKKPAPDIFLLALARLGLGPGAAIAFEDTVYGLRAARAARLATVVTPSFYTDDQDFYGAASVFDMLGEPTAPATWIAGEGRGSTMVTVDLLRRILN